MNETTVLLVGRGGVRGGVLERRLRRLGFTPPPPGELADVAVVDARGADRPPAAPDTGTVLVLADDPASGAAVDAGRAVIMVAGCGGEGDRAMGMALRISAALGR